MTLYLETSSGSFQPWQRGAPFPNGTRCDADIESLWSDDELAAVDLYRPAPADQPPAGKAVVSTGVERVEGVVKFVHVLVDIPFEEQRDAKRAALADRRWQAETGGVDFNGSIIRSDATSQAKITGAVSLFASDPSLTAIDWEAQAGVWVQLDAATMTAIGVAVGRHVQGCFTHARTLDEAINAAEDQAALDAVDIEQGWP